MSGPPLNVTSKMISVPIGEKFTPYITPEETVDLTRLVNHPNHFAQFYVYNSKEQSPNSRLLKGTVNLTEVFGILRQLYDENQLAPHHFLKCLIRTPLWIESHPERFSEYYLKIQESIIFSTTNLLKQAVKICIFIQEKWDFFAKYLPEDVTLVPKDNGSQCKINRLHLWTKSQTYREEYDHNTEHVFFECNEKILGIAHEFLETGNLDLTNMWDLDEYFDLYDFASKYKINSLEEASVQGLTGVLSKDNVMDIFEFAVKNKITPLLLNCFPLLNKSCSSMTLRHLELNYIQISFHCKIDSDIETSILTYLLSQSHKLCFSLHDPTPVFSGLTSSDHVKWLDISSCSKMPLYKLGEVLKKFPNVSTLTLSHFFKKDEIFSLIKIFPQINTLILHDYPEEVTNDSNMPPIDFVIFTGKLHSSRNSHFDSTTPTNIVSFDIRGDQASRLWELDLRKYSKLNDHLLMLFAQSSPNLHTLLLDNLQNITDLGVIKLTKCVKISSISLAGCDQVTDKALIPVFQSCQKLEIVNLSGCSQLNDEALIALSGEERLGKNPANATTPYLRELNIKDCPNITDNGLIPVIKRNPNLVSLDISGCYNITEKVFDVLTRQCLKLSELRVNGISCIPSIIDKIASVFPKLEKLSIHDNRITDEHLLQLSNAKLSFRELILNECSQVTGEGIQALIPSMEKAAILQFNGCSLLDDQALREVPKKCPKIRKIMLRNTNISAMLVNELLNRCPLLTNIDVRGCPNITPQMAINMMKNTIVSKINLSSTTLKSEDIQLLLDSCENLNTLQVTNYHDFDPNTVNKFFSKLRNEKKYCEIIY